MSAYRRKQCKMMRNHRLCLVLISIFLIFQILLTIHLIFRLRQESPMNAFIRSEFETLEILSMAQPSLSSEKSLFVNIRRKPMNSSRHLRLCRKHFQQNFDLKIFNRTLILYEVEWENHRELNILFLLLENIEIIVNKHENFAQSMSKYFSIECTFSTTTSKGKFLSRQVQSDDRSVVVQCPSTKISENDNEAVKLRLTHRQSQLIYQITIPLCWIRVSQGSLVHCLPPLAKKIPTFFLQQWLDYHLLLGVEQFYIYDQILLYQDFLQYYFKRKQIVYFPFRLPSLLTLHENFSIIHQQIAQIHCLMNVRSSFQWISSWNFDQYLDFFSDQQEVFVTKPSSSESGSQSMLNDYLSDNFQQIGSIRLNSVNFYDSKTEDGPSISVRTHLLVEQHLYRSTIWTQGENYLIKLEPNVALIDFDDLVKLPEKLKFEQLPPTRFSRSNKKNAHEFIHLNVYPIRNSMRSFQSFVWSNKTKIWTRDKIPWHVLKSLYKLNRNENQLKKTEKDFF